MEAPLDSQFHAVRRKLEALNYLEDLDPRSVPLVSRLIDDLVHTTESYRELKADLSNVKQKHDVEAQKVDVFRKENGRLLQENNQLHQKLLKEAENSSAKDRAHIRASKKLEDELADLRFWKSQSLEKMRQLEEQNEQWRLRVNQMVQPAGSKQQAGNSGGGGGGYMHVSDLPGPSTRQLPPRHTDNEAFRDSRAIGILRLAEARCASLDKELASVREERAELGVKAEGLQRALAAKDAEISRLSSMLEGGREAQQLTAEYQQAAAREMIQTLNHQVEYLTTQLQAAEEAINVRARLEDTVARLQSQTLDLQREVQDKARENAEIHQEVRCVQDIIQELQEPSPADRGDVGSAFSSNMQLEEVKRTRAHLLEVVHQLKQQAADETAARERLQRRGDDLLAELEHTREALASLRTDKEDAMAEVASQRRHIAELEARVQSLSEELAKCREEESSAHEQSQSLAHARDQLAEDLQQTRALAGRLQEELRGERGRAEGSEESRASLRQRKDELTQQLQKLEHHSEAVQADRLDLQLALKDLRQERVQLSASLSEERAERERLQSLSNALREDLRLEQERTESLDARVVALELQLAKTSAEARAGAEEKAVLNQQLEQRQAKLAELETSTRNYNQLHTLPPKMEALRHQVAELQSQVLEHEVQAAKLGAEAAGLREALRMAQEDKADLVETLQESQALRKELAGRLKDSDDNVARTQASLAALRARNEATATSLQRVEQELETQREQSQEYRMAARSASGAAEAAERKAAKLQLELAALREEQAAAAESREARQQEAASHAVQAQQLREAELRGRLGAAGEEVEALRAELAACGAELEELREDARLAKGRAKEALAELQLTKEQLQGTERDVEQLRTLVAHLDATREELVAKLRATRGELRVVEARVGSVEEEKGAAVAERDSVAAEAARLCTVVAALDSERDAMQAEADARTEELKRLQEECNRWQEAAADAQRAAARAGQRLKAAEERGGDAERQALSLGEQLQQQQDTARNLQEEVALRDSESQVLREDLASMAKEHQVAQAQLKRVHGEADGLRRELRDVCGRLGNAEQLLTAKEKEVSELLRSLQQLSDEHQQLAAVAEQADCQVHEYRLQLAGAEGALNSAHDHIRLLESENMQYISDLKMLEQQTDSLSRSLGQSSAMVSQQQEERASLLGDIAAAKQALMELELSRGSLQRELAALSGSHETLQRRLEQAMQEAQGLSARWSAEHQRVKELETLVAVVRAQGQGHAHAHTHGPQRLNLPALQDRGGDSMATSARAASLEGQVHALQSQVRTLEAVRGGQARELEEMRGRLRQATRGGGEAQAGSRASGRDAGVASEDLQRLERECKELREDNERMLLLLSEMDNQRLEAQRSAQPEPSSGGAAVSEEQLQAMQRQVGELRTQLAESEARRQSLQKDFDELVAGVEGFKAVTVGGRSRGLEERLMQVVAENEQLRTDLATAVDSCGATELDLQRLRQEYAGIMEMVNMHQRQQRPSRDVDPNNPAAPPSVPSHQGASQEA